MTFSASMAPPTHLEPSSSAEDAPAATVPATAQVRMFSGREAVLGRSLELEELAGRSGQPGAMHGLAYLVDHEHASRKTPCLVTFISDEEELLGAVLLFEYRLGSWPTGVFSTGDSFGVRTVIGPASWRADLAAAAAAALLSRSARIVLVSFRAPSGDPIRTGPVPSFISTPGEATPAKPVLWSVRTRAVQDRLPLAATFDRTLAQMGKRTRTHLRYYRRRLEEAVPCAFFPDISRFVDPADVGLLLELNRRSLDPIAQESFDLQLRSALEPPGGFVCGLRSRAGEWLALAGGWRQDGTTWVQWQTNAAGYETLSVGTALRAFLIEHEVARGSRWLAFHGGTSHSMSHAFPLERVIDLLGRRKGGVPLLLARAVPTLYRLMPALARRGNFVADALSIENLRWLPTDDLSEALSKAAGPEPHPS